MGKEEPAKLRGPCLKYWRVDRGLNIVVLPLPLFLFLHRPDPTAGRSLGIAKTNCRCDSQV